MAAAFTELMLAILLSFGVALVAADPGERPDLPPPQGLSCTAKIVDVVDGDTLTAELRIRTRIRLLDCWADETRTKDADAKARGLKAKSNLTDLALDQDAIIFIPWKEGRLDQVLTFGRVLAYVWVDKKSLAKQQVAGGFASTTKEGRLGE